MILLNHLFANFFSVPFQLNSIFNDYCFHSHRFKIWIRLIIKLIHFKVLMKRHFFHSHSCSFSLLNWMWSVRSQKMQKRRKFRVCFGFRIIIYAMSHNDYKYSDGDILRSDWILKFTSNLTVIMEFKTILIWIWIPKKS